MTSHGDAALAEGSLANKTVNEHTLPVTTLLLCALKKLCHNVLVRAVDAQTRATVTLGNRLVLAKLNIQYQLVEIGICTGIMHRRALNEI